MCEYNMLRSLNIIRVQQITHLVNQFYIPTYKKQLQKRLSYFHEIRVFLNCAFFIRKRFK